MRPSTSMNESEFYLIGGIVPHNRYANIHWMMDDKKNKLDDGW